MFSGLERQTARKTNNKCTSNEKHLNLAVSGSISSSSRTGDLGTHELNFSIRGSIMGEYARQTAERSIPLSI